MWPILYFIYINQGIVCQNLNNIMPDKMLKFVKIGQQTPPKREVDTRKNDFKEIYEEYINKKAKEQLPIL